MTKLRDDPAYLAAAESLVGILCVHPNLIRFCTHIRHTRFPTIATRYVFRCLVAGGDPMADPELEPLAVTLMARLPDPTRFIVYKGIVEEPS